MSLSMSFGASKAFALLCLWFWEGQSHQLFLFYLLHKKGPTVDFKLFLPYMCYCLALQATVHLRSWE